MPDCKNDDEKTVLKKLVEKVYDIDTELQIAKSIGSFKDVNKMSDTERQDLQRLKGIQTHAITPIIEKINAIPNCPVKKTRKAKITKKKE